MRTRTTQHYCLHCEWCELCSMLSTIMSLHSSEHIGQSEINVLSLGNTQEVVSFIVLSPADNCFAVVSQMRKRWVYEKEQATVCPHGHSRACLHNLLWYFLQYLLCKHFLYYFPVLPLLSNNCQLQMRSGENLCWNFAAPIDCSYCGVFEDWFSSFCLHVHCSVPKCSSL